MSELSTTVIKEIHHLLEEQYVLCPHIPKSQDIRENIHRNYYQAKKYVPLTDGQIQVLEQKVEEMAKQTNPSESTRIQYLRVMVQRVKAMEQETQNSDTFEQDVKQEISSYIPDDFADRIIKISTKQETLLKRLVLIEDLEELMVDFYLQVKRDITNKMESEKYFDDEL